MPGRIRSLLNERRPLYLKAAHVAVEMCIRDRDMDRVQKGDLSPVFFGSALTNFGVETFLEHFLKMTTQMCIRDSL